jgi:hypothetical protein
MLITKELEFKIAGNVYDFYKKNNIPVEFNKINKLPIELVNPKSHLLVDAKCDICGKEVKIQYRRYNQSISRGGYYTCSSKCSGEKRKKTILKKFGDENMFKTQIFKEKTQQTNLEKWGEKHFRVSDKWKDQNKNSEILKRKKTIFENFIKVNTDIIGQDEDNFIVKCKIHGENKIPKSLFSNRKIVKTEYCCICNPINKNISGKEVLLLKLIKEMYDGEIIQSFKINRKEIDIYLPDLKIGFEFNGLKWHSEVYLENEYHLKKTKLCLDNNIRLIHIFEDDFDYKLDIIKSIIKNVLNHSTRVYARNTLIKQVTDKNIIKDFLDKNHLQGFVNTNINYGLYYDDELVSLMTFMKTRKVINKSTKECEYELVRFCNKIGLTIVGGASKLFNKFLKEYNPKSVLSYCDISWANGNIYKKLGFKLVGTTKPNYYYIINGKKENRINYQKHKLVKKGYDKNLTEVEIMSKLGYYRIFNCGNQKYLYVN